MKRWMLIVSALSVAMVGCTTVTTWFPWLSWQTRTTGKAVLQPTAPQSPLTGVVKFVETSEGLRMTASVQHAPPGAHGFHIHEVGSCEDGARAAGSHYNPAGSKHGYLPKEGFLNAHAGDFGNISVGKHGSGSTTLLIPMLTLVGGSYPVAWKSVILHANADDFTSQPTGNAGDRIACGIIEVKGK